MIKAKSITRSEKIKGSLPVFLGAAIFNIRLSSIIKNILFLLFFSTSFNLFSQTVLFTDDFETDKGWVLTGEFQRGAPGGLGGDHGNPDPSAAVSGTNILGVDLTGLGTFPGDYENNLTNRQYTATSPVFNCTGYELVTLEFQRWLNVEQDTYDNAYIEVSNDGGTIWNVVWENVNTTIVDNSWSLNSVNISAFAANQASVQVRFSMGTSDGSWQYCGWNIDDLNVLGQSLIWKEDFSGLADGTTTGTGSPAIASWTADGVDGSTRGIDVRANQLRGRRTSTPGFTNWVIDVGNPIEITGYSNVTVSMNISDNGNNDPTDNIRVQYSVDGAPFADFATNGFLSGSFTSTEALQTGLTGNSLRLQIIMTNNANNENYLADDILVTGTLLPAGDTYYSYQSGNWNNSSTWTHDPGGTTQNAVDFPGDGDKVVILDGRTVSLSGNVTTVNNSITLRQNGILNLSTFQFVNPLTLLSGAGTLKLASVNFPTVVTNDFVNIGGGTTEYNNAANFTLPAAQTTYNHLRINAPTVVATQMSNITLNGDLHLKQGTLQINDNTIAKRQLIIYGNVTVDAGASITVGTGRTTSTGAMTPTGTGTGGVAPFIDYYESESHHIEIYGDFTNNGTVKFTNQAYPVFNAFPYNGFATVYFRGATSNTLTCNNTTDFYNLVLDKGIDQSFSLTISSSTYSNFRLFGANIAGGDGGGGNPNLKKALWIRTGTLILKGLTIIPSLSEANIGGAPNGDFYIPTNGALLLDGTEVVILSTADDYREVNVAYGVAAPSNAAMGILNGGGTQSFSVYGKFQVNNGYFSTRESGGLITWNVASGQFVINGGTVDAKQFRSVGGGGGLASFDQSGGTFILRGRFQRTTTAFSSVTDLINAPLNTTRATGGLDGTLGTFNLNELANVFTMTGGTIRIYDVCGDGSVAAQQKVFEVLSSTGNINVTGGTLELLPTTGSGTDSPNHIIISNASFGNVTINRASSTSTILLNTYPLNILKNLNLTSGVLNANSLNVSVGGNFTVANGTTYTPGTNWTIFNGTGSQSFTVNTAGTLALKKLKIDKPTGTTLTLTGSQAIISVQDSLMLINGNLADGGKTIQFTTSATTTTSYIFNSGVHTGSGKIQLADNDPQIIAGDGNGVFQNIELNNTDALAAPVSLGANITINGILTFSQDKLFDIATYNLKFGSSASVINAGANRYIQSAGNAGDGGITKVYSASSTSFTFHGGAPSTRHAAVNYTPATLSFGTLPTVYGSITVIPVGYEHPNTTTKGRSLTYFWRVKSSGFTLGAATINHSYTYSQNDVVSTGNITEPGYVAARYNNTTYTWTRNLATDVNETTNIIGGAGTNYANLTIIDGEFTAGDDNPTNPFGTPTKYYSRQSGLWSSTNTWSLTGHTGGAAPAVPGASDVVIIGGNDSVYLATNNTVANTGIRSCASLQIEVGSALDNGYNPGSNFGIVLNHANGNGNFRITTSWNTRSTFAFPSGDFTDFNINLGTTELYSTNPTAGSEYYLPNGINTYGNLILSPLGGSNIMFPNNDVLIYGNLVTRGQNADSWYCPTWDGNYPTAPTVRVPKTITVKGDMEIQGGALVWYGNGAITQNFIIYGDVIVYPNSAIDVWSGATSQNLSIGGSLINNTVGTTAGGTTTPRRCDFTLLPVTFFGANTASVTNTVNNPVTIFSTVTINKGTSQTDSLIINIGGTLTTPADNWLTFQNGTLKYSRTDPSSDFTISQGTPVTIPSTSGLYIDYPNNATNRNILIADAASDNNDLFLNGKLTLRNGEVYIGRTNGTTNNNNDIEYSGGGASAIDLQGGNLVVNGQIRRNPATTNGILMYTQSGGNLTVNGMNTNTTNAKLEVLNTGSVFNMSGGTITIVRGGGGNTYGDLYLRAETSTVTGGEIIFTQSPLVGPVVDAVQDYILDANVALNDLTITGKTAGTNRNATVTLLISPLNLNGNLTISNGNSILDVNTNFNINVSLKGDFDNSGTYNHYNNLTTFNGGTQAILGSSPISFYDLTVDPLTKLTLNHDANIKNVLILKRGTLECSTYFLYVQGDITNNATYTDTNTGIVLNGTVQQNISGTGTFGRLDLNNPNGARVNNGITLQKNLKLTSGVLDINEHLLILGVNSAIEGSSFSSSKMIASDGVFSNVGIQKYFPIYSGVAQTFTYPLGTSGKYTPTVLTYTQNTNVGYLRVNNINSHHQGVLDITNVLDYFWEVESNGLAGFNGSLVLNYLEEDVVLNGHTEAEYIAAALLIPGTSWIKSIDDVDENLNTITFNYSSVSSLSGEYTCGVDPALPDKVPEFTSINDGDWSNPANWTQTDGDPYILTGAPNGFIVIIDSDDEVTTDINYASAYRTTINGKLKVVSPTFGHNLGTVSGSGTLYMENGTFPAGRYTNFLTCSNNATIEYGGSTNYTLISDLYSTIPILHFTGTGTRSLPNKDLTICTQLLIDGPTLDNTVNNRKLTIQGTMERYNTGAFNSGSGAGAIVSFAGTAAQTIGGALGDFTGTNSFNHFEINNSTGLAINTNGLVEIAGNLMLTSGNIITSSTNKLTITNTTINSVTPAGGSASSYVDGPLIKKIIQGDSFLFPLGKGTELGNKLTLTSTQTGTLLWTAEYFTPNSTYTSFTAPLTYINSKEYWKVNAVSGSQAYVNLRWDPLSDLTPLMTQNGLSDMRVANYNTATTSWVENASSASGNNNNGTVSTTSRVVIPATGSGDYTTSCINITKPRARLNPSGAVCGTAGIPVTFTGVNASNLNYILTYKKGGVLQPAVNIGVLPYTLPTDAIGTTYQLVSFTYNNPPHVAPIVTGVVDPAIVTTYTVPTTANAGPNQSICGGTSATLAANTPTTGTGQWSIISGAGGTVVTPTSPTSTFNGTNGTTYTLRWTISNGGCTSTSNVTIAFPLNPVQPDAFTASSALVCQGESGVIYTVPNDPSVTYTWSYGGTGHTINGTTNSITVDFNATATSETLRVTATNGCGTSAARTIAITVNPVATITLVDANIQVCQGGTSTNLAYSATTGSPNQYSLDFDLAAESEGFADVVDIVLSGSPIVITVPGTATLGTYNANLVVANNPANCPSVDYPITIEVNAIPAPTITGEDTTCVGTSLVYTTEAGMNNYIWTVDGTYGSIVLGSGTNSITVDWTNYTALGSPTTISVSYDNAGCVPASAGTLDVMVFKIPDTGPQYHIENVWGN